MNAQPTTQVIRTRKRLTALLASAAMAITAVTFQSSASQAAPDVVIDDFESGAAPGSPCPAGGLPLGFCTFNGAGSSVVVSTTSLPPAPAPGNGSDVLQMEVDVTSFAGFIRGFTNAAGDAWVSQNWSTREGISMWFHGTGSGTKLFIDILENRNPGSTTDDAQRWTVEFVDDFTGWRLLEFPFTGFTRKTVGNGAPTDPFDRFDVHGWALGALGTGGARTYYVDDVGLYGAVEPPALATVFAKADFGVEEGSTGDITVKLNRPMNADDPAQVSVDYEIEALTPIPGREYTPVSGTLTFVNGGPLELSFPFETFDDSKNEPDERVILRLSNPVDVELPAAQAAATIIDNDPFDPLLIDDFEQFPYLWDSTGDVTLDNLEVANGDPLAVPGQGTFEGVLTVTMLSPENVEIQGRICNNGSGVIPVKLHSTDDFDATTVDHTTVRLGAASEVHVDKKTGEPKRHVANDDLIFHFAFKDTGLTCDPDVVPFSGSTFDGHPIAGSFSRDFPIGQDWTGNDALGFWYYGQGTGDEITVDLLDNRAPDPGPDGWSLVWSDEFDEPAGTPPNPANWGFENGDGTVNGIPGWGNDELQYYTDSTDNVATDGEGNLVITAREADGELCYYGPCDYTSARLVSKQRAEFAYGRIESRILVPDGEDGLWPAFWSLGTDIDQVAWPQTGEIDIMEYVSRVPDEVFGTIHGPGYSGGNAFGNILNIPSVADDYHTFTIEWEPDLINWYVDDILYHTATPADVAPNEWVFNDPIFLLLNLALGGNFGGSLSDDLTFPQEMAVDYVRVYQGPDTAERFESTFTDDVAGWQQIELPFDSFTRSALQPAGAPDDGLGLAEVWGYGFRTPGSTGTVMLDQVHLIDVTPPTVAITDDVAVETATGDVTFTFAFSEDVGTSFTGDDVVLTGGTKGVFTRIDSKHATLVARPPADSTGVLEVNVAAGTFTDLAGNLNVLGASAQQAYDTPLPPDPGGGFVITFDESPPARLEPFEGLGGSVVADPGDASNNVASLTKPAVAQPWAGTLVYTQDDPAFSVPVIPFSDGNTTVTARFWTERPAGIPVMLKVENSGNAGQFKEVIVNTTTSGEWETLSFDFAGLDTSLVWDKVAVFPDFFTAEHPGGAYYVDDITFPAAPPPPGFVITFDESPPARLEPFEGLGGSVVADPGDASNNVASLTKPAVAQPWAGTLVYTQDDPAFSVPVIPFSDGNTTVTARFWTERPAGIPVMLKVENSGNAGQFKEVIVNTTTSGEWETLSFDFAGLDTSLVWDKVAVFPDFFTAEHPGGAYYVDDITFPAGSTPPPPPPPPSDGFVITFDEAIAPVLIDFGGNAGALVTDPTDPTNMVAQVLKTTGAEIWAGTTVSTGPNQSVPVIPLAPGSSTMTARVWSPDAGIPVRLKAEDANNVTHTVETQTLTTVAGAWETLTFDFANEAPGTEPLIHPDWTFSKISIFFDFGTPGADKTYYVDDITWPISAAPATLITFDEATPPTLVGFGGAEDSQVVVDPTDPSNKVAQVVKAAGAEIWAGTTVSTGPNQSVGVILFSATNTSVTARVWSPDAGIPVRLKVENSANPGVSVETEATTTVASDWETLSFDFADEVVGTAALNLDAKYDKVSIFFDFGTPGADKVYFFDDLDLVPFAAGGGGGGAGFVVTFDEATPPELIGFGGAVGTVVVDPTDGSNMVGQVVKTAGAETWAGTTVATGPSQSVPVIPLAPGRSIMTARVWSPDAGIPVRLKAEDANNATHTVETQTLTTVAGAWETLTFDFANEAPGTEPLIHPDWTFSKVSIFFDFGTPGAGKTYYVDDITWPAT